MEWIFLQVSSLHSISDWLKVQSDIFQHLQWQGMFQNILYSVVQGAMLCSRT